jgi:putative effector of murein hydrolase
MSGPAEAADNLDLLWVYLQQEPLLWLTATLGAYVIGHSLHRAAGGSPLVNSVAVAIVLLVTLLVATGTGYATYFDGAQFVHFLLGPATVLLAVPLYRNFNRVRRLMVPMLAALLAGSVTAVVSAVAIAAALGASRETMLSLAPKSATTPIAMGIAEGIGGLASLTAALVIMTGIVGAMIVTPLLNCRGPRGQPGALRVTDWAARGFAVGVASHGIGAARAFQVNQVAGTFAGIAMALNALLTAVLVPLLVGWV